MADESGHVFRTCSGTLIAPNLVLTAQHCVAETAQFVDCHTASFGPPLSAEHVRMTTAVSMWSDIAVWHAAESVHVPTGSPAVCGRDISLIVLREIVTEDEAEPMTPRLDRAVEQEEVYSAVGYGTSAEGSSDAGVRRRRDDLFVACVGPGCGSAEHVDGREWRGEQGICSGDSGGPALDPHGGLIGVTSRGPLGCDDPVYGGVTAWKSWIRSVAEDAARTGGYPKSWWVDSAAAGYPEGKTSLSSDAWSSCSATPRRPAGGGAPAAPVLAALALLAARALRRTQRDSSRIHD
jgi:hypothetical protein